MTKEGTPQSPAPDSASEDQYKSKRGRKPSQAKLAMLESKKLFSESKKKSTDVDSSNENGNNKKQIKKKKIISSNNEDTSKIKKKKLIKNKNSTYDNNKSDMKSSKRTLRKEDKDETEEEPKKRKRKHPLRYRGDESDDSSGSDTELWNDKRKEQDDMFFDSEDDDIDNEFLQNSDEDTEDASETDMATLEEEISEMKEKMCQEKIKELKKKLEELENRTLPEYLMKLEELNKQKEDWIRLAYAYKTFEEKEIEREYEREKKTAKQEFERKRNELKEVLVSELGEKKRLIESEKSALELTGSVSSILPMEVKPPVTRKLRRRPNEPLPVAEKKRKTPTAQLNYLLNEDQVTADIKKLNKHRVSHDDEKPIIKPLVKPEKCDPSEFPDGSDSKIKDEQLYFNNDWYQAGDPIYLNSRDGERFNAQIHSINSNREIWIKKLTEGTRLKIFVGHLQRGKYAIERRETGSSKKS